MGTENRAKIGVAKGHCRNAEEVTQAVQRFRKTQARVAEGRRAAAIVKICEAAGCADRIEGWILSAWGLARIRREAANLAALREAARRAS